MTDKWNAQRETIDIMKQVNKLAAMLDKCEEGNPYRQIEIVRDAIWMALNRANSAGFEAGKHFERDER